jgi:hypothetical protein
MYIRNVAIVTLANVDYNVSPTHLNEILGVGNFNDGGPRVCRPTMRQSYTAMAERLRNTHIVQLMFNICLTENRLYTGDTDQVRVMIMSLTCV